MNNAKSNFLSALKETLSSSGVPISIAGEDMIVVKLANSKLAELGVLSEKLAKESLEESEKDLRKKKASARDRKEFRDSLNKAGIGQAFAPSIETEYDLTLANTKMVILSKLMTAEAVRFPDGSKTWDTESERIEIAETMLAIPGVEDRIQAAFVEAQKKRVIEQSTTSNAKPSKE